MAEPSQIEKPQEPVQPEPEIEIEIVDEPAGEAAATGGDKQDADADHVDDVQQSDSQDQADRKRQNRIPAKKRIDELTRDKRELERALAMRDAEHAHALEVSERRVAELADRMARMESTYNADTTEARIHQAESQVEANLSTVKQRIKDAADNADNAALVEAQTELAQLVNAKSRIAEFKANYQRERDKPKPEPKPEPQRPQFHPNHARLLQKWVGENEWFTDPRHAEMNVLAQAIDARLAQEGRFDPRTDDYYAELSRRLDPHLLAAGVKEPDQAAPQKEQPQSRPSITAAVAGVTRAPATSSTSQKMKLTREEVQIAEKLGVSLQDYAAQKLRREQRIASQ